MVCKWVVVEIVLFVIGYCWLCGVKCFLFCVCLCCLVVLIFERNCGVKG